MDGNSIGYRDSKCQPVGNGYSHTNNYRYGYADRYADTNLEYRADIRCNPTLGNSNPDHLIDADAKSYANGHALAHANCCRQSESHFFTDSNRNIDLDRDADPHDSSYQHRFDNAYSYSQHFADANRYTDIVRYQNCDQHTQLDCDRFVDEYADRYS